MYVIPSYIPIDIVPKKIASPGASLEMGGSGVSPGEPWVASTFGGESLRKNYGKPWETLFFGSDLYFPVHFLKVEFINGRD